MFKTHTSWEFPGGSVVRTLHFYCWGHRFNPFSGNLNPACHRVLPKKKKNPPKGHSISLTFYGEHGLLRLSVYAFLIKKPGRRLRNLHFGRIPSSDYFPWRDCLLEAVKKRQECSYSAYQFYSGRKLVSLGHAGGQSLKHVARGMEGP